MFGMCGMKEGVVGRSEPRDIVSEPHESTPSSEFKSPTNNVYLKTIIDSRGSESIYQILRLGNHIAGTWWTYPPYEVYGPPRQTT